MKKDAIAKAAVTKKMNQLAGPRRTLPGQNPHREAMLRSELAASFRPKDTSEMLWVHDIAYCTANMEAITAQISAVQMHHVVQASRAALAENPFAAHPELAPSSPYSPDERAHLEELSSGGFTAAYNGTLLNDPIFASLHGSVTGAQIKISRELQQLLHDERKERDRIINQLERRRRNAMRDAIERAEEGRRAEAFSRLCAERAASGVDGGKAVKLITCDTGDEEVIEAEDVSNDSDAEALGSSDTHEPPL